MDYTFEKLKNDLSIGHEIEFTYSDRKFSITNTPNGWVLTEYYKEDAHVFSSHHDLLQHGTIDGRSLQSIWHDVTVTTVF